MPLRHLRRPLALLALALALLAALPCATLASSDSCCGSQARCGDPGSSPCAQLSATPCCDVNASSVDASTAAPLPPAPLLSARAEAPPLAPALRVHAVQAPLRDVVALRSVVLRL